jgi:hemoglobin
MNHATRTIVASVFIAINALFTLGNAQNSSINSNSAAFQAFGAKPGLVKLMDDFMTRLVADERTSPFFKPSNQTRVKEQLVEQFCQVLDGGCVYKGADMKSSHANFDINKGHFNALVEILQTSMDAQGVPFAAQRTLLAGLAHMHKDIITVR